MLRQRPFDFGNQAIARTKGSRYKLGQAAERPHILLTARLLDEHGKCQYQAVKESLCVKDVEERDFTPRGIQRYRRKRLNPKKLE